MFKFRYLLVCEGWKEHTVNIEQDHEGFAYVDVINIIRSVLHIRCLDFMALGNGEYVIWGRGKCQGYMSVKKVGQETPAQGSDAEG